MRTLTITKKVMTELARDKRTLLLMFVGPLIILWLMNTMFSANSDVKVTLATVNVKQEVVTDLDKVSGVSVKKYSSSAKAKRALKKRRVDGVIVKKGSRYTVTHANVDSSKTALTKSALKAALVKSQTSSAAKQAGKLRRSLIAQQKLISKLSQSLAKLSGKKAAAQTSSQTQSSQASTSSQKVKIVNHYRYGDKDTGYFAKIAPILMAFFIFFFVLLISGMALLGERTTGTLDRLLATPVKRSDIVFGYMLGYGILGLLQAIVISVAGIYILKIEVVGSLADLILVCVLTAFVALAFGLLLSTFAESEFQMMQFLPLVIVPQVFFSGIIPLSSMASWVQVIGKILPLTYAGDAMTGIIMNGASLAQVAGDLWALVLFLIVLTAVNILGLKRYRKV
ncbi:ABC transporter permease [Lactobacillus nasalidis]|uniref:ABC transporter permease n=5 Tax=Lactobacillus nasalidis TaxID=2797258 RepID=A0ABQ3W907_9LACO|nr:ABC transporter permease [Lactobacillus nasalidis]GHW01352.1 ABC transporter permease [Lactobacillus nasalidis]